MCVLCLCVTAQVVIRQDVHKKEIISSFAPQKIVDPRETIFTREAIIFQLFNIFVMDFFVGHTMNIDPF